MNILLLVSGFNGLTQRVWCALREGGHRVDVQLALDDTSMLDAVRHFKPDLILCPFLKERVPAEIWRQWPTVIVHPGPVGDRGPSSLDYAIMDGARVWGVTALQAVEEMDAGPVWATRTFAMPAEPPTKSALYNGPVADAALECVKEVVAKAADPAFRPVPLERAPRPVPGTGLRPLLTAPERRFAWDDDPAAIVRRIRAADGFPGVRAELAGRTVSVFDAAVGRIAGAPGELLGHRYGAVLVGTGRGSVWIGQAKAVPTDGQPTIKLPATTVLRPRGLAEAPAEAGGAAYTPATYTRRGPVGVLTMRVYNGAMSTRQCRQIAAALRKALREDTRVLVLRGTADAFSNGIHLGVVEAAADPAVEGWANIRAINAICRRVCANSRQVVLSAYTANSGAGGVMLGLGADAVVAREGVVFNPYYDIGLFGSELHTYALPARIGANLSAQLLARKLPIDTTQAHRIGLIDAIGPRDAVAFDAWLGEIAVGWAEDRRWRAVLEAKTQRAGKQRWPLSYHETTELAEMARDLFDNRSGFTEARQAFVYKRKPATTPLKLRA